MSSTGSSGGLPPNNIPKTSTSADTTAQNTQQNQNTDNTPPPRRSSGPTPADKNTPIMSNNAANASYAQVAGQIRSASSADSAQQAAAGTRITLSNGTTMELDFSKINNSTLSGLQNAEFEDFEDDDDGTGVSQRDKDLLAAAFGMFNAV